MAKAPPHATQRDLGAAVNNAVLLARDTKYFNDLKAKDEKKFLSRQRRLRAYSEGHVQIIKEHVQEELLHPDEAVLVLVSEALVICGLFYKGLKLPLYADFGKSLIEDGIEIGE